MPRLALLLAWMLVVLAGCAGNQQKPIYKPVSELKGCQPDECVEAKLAFRHWADAPFYKGRMLYHCDPGSELDGRPDPQVTRLIVAIHGVVGVKASTFRELDEAPGLLQLRNVTRAMREAKQRDPSFDPDSVAIIAPTFQRDEEWQPYTDEDPRVWTWKRSSFNQGNNAVYRENRVGWVKAEEVSSFDVLDEFLRAALIKFPRLETIVLVGHSTGGQTVHRYALAGVGIHERLTHEGIEVRYMPANGGGFVFPSPVRKLPPGQSSLRSNAGRGDNSNWRFTTPRGCKGYDDWGRGLGNIADHERLTRAAEYAIDHYLKPHDRKLARKARSQGIGSKTWAHAARLALRLQYASRQIWHFQAATDREPKYEECTADLQGRSRYERFSNFQQLWTEQNEIPTDNLHFVALTDASHPHSSRVVYTSDAGVHVLFF